MNYIGSKLSLLSFLRDSIFSVTNGKFDTFCDLFAGTGIVGSHFKELGYTIISNDIQYYSYILNRHYIGNNEGMNFLGLDSTVKGPNTVQPQDRSKFVCEYLANLSGRRGFIYKNYCIGGTLDGDTARQYFSDNNGTKCDAIRNQIERWKIQHLINDDEYFFLLATLLESIDKHANTASVYGAFLKNLKKTAQKDLSLVPARIIPSELPHRVYNKDINELVSEIEGDVFYLDPPYNQRQYFSNYHLLETIAKYDNPQIRGKTGLRVDDSQKSNYCSKRKVKREFADLILKSKAKYIFLSYNNEGLMDQDDIKQILSLKGKYGFCTKKYSRFKADTSDNRNYTDDQTIEYLHYVICKN